MKKGVGAALILTAALMSLSCTSMVTSMMRNSDPHVWDEALPPEDSVWVLFTCIGNTSVVDKVRTGASDGITAYNGVEVDWKWNRDLSGTWVRLPPGPASFVGNFTRNDGSVLYFLRGTEFSFDFTETGNPQELAGKYYLLEMTSSKPRTSWIVGGRVIPLEGKNSDLGWGMNIYLIDIEEQLNKKVKVQVGYKAWEPYKIAFVPFSNIAKEEAKK